MYCGDEVSAIVGDIGSSVSKFGYAGEDLPKLVCPSVVGRTGKKSDKKRIIAGTSALFSKREESMSLHKPREYSVIKHYDVVEELWEYAYDELRVDAKEHPVLVADSPFATDEEINKYAEIMFEKFNVPCMYVASDAVLSAFAYGRANALVVDCGAGSTRAVPVQDGYVLNASSQVLPFGGDKLDEMMASCLKTPENEIVFDSRYKSMNANVLEETEAFMKKEIYRDIKESCCRMSETTLNEFLAKSMATEKYELPDGQVIELGLERYKVAENLMNPPSDISKPTDMPNLAPHITTSPLPRMLYDVVKNNDPDLRRELLNHIILCGGGSLIPSLGVRLQNEITKMVPSTFKVRVVSASSMEKKFSVFTGGSILASLGSFQQLWLSRQEYDDKGTQKLNEAR